MSFCVAGVALCDIPSCLQTCRKSFCMTGAILLRRSHKMSCRFRGRRSTLETSIVILRGRRSTSDSDKSHCVLYTPHSALYTPHSNSTLYTSHSTLYIPHFTLHTLHTTFYSFRGRCSALDVSIVILRGRRSTFWTCRVACFCESHCQGCVKWPQGANSVAGVSFCVPYTPHSALYTPHSTLYTSHSKLYIPHFTRYTLHSILYTLHYTLHTLHSTLHT